LNLQSTARQHDGRAVPDHRDDHLLRWARAITLVTSWLPCSFRSRAKRGGSSWSDSPPDQLTPDRGELASLVHGRNIRGIWATGSNREEDAYLRCLRIGPTTAGLWSFAWVLSRWCRSTDSSKRCFLGKSESNEQCWRSMPCFLTESTARDHFVRSCFPMF
jgi:hypothetical protein